MSCFSNVESVSLVVRNFRMELLPAGHGVFQDHHDMDY